MINHWLDGFIREIQRKMYTYLIMFQEIFSYNKFKVWTKSKLNNNNKS